MSASGGSAPLICYRGLMVTTPPFHGGNGGSIPPGSIMQTWPSLVYGSCLESIRSKGPWVQILPSAPCERGRVAYDTCPESRGTKVP